MQRSRALEWRIAAIAALAFFTAGLMALHHIRLLMIDWSDWRLIGVAMFAWLAFSAVLPYAHRDVRWPTAGTNKRELLERLRVLAIIPAHREDLGMFRTMLDSLSQQSRLPARIHVVENGDPTTGYEPTLEPVFRDWEQHSCPQWIETEYTFHPAAGKRDAQAVAIRADPEADIILTLDSDVQLSERAIEAGLAPFARRRVMSVGGLLLGLNAHANWLTRLVEPLFVCASLNGRVAQSMLGTVWVNSGALAFYRGHVVRAYLKHYLTHTVAGKRMNSGDDAMLTRYAMLEGETRFQIGCWGYTLHPERLGHLTGQRLRWWRSYFWGNAWLLRVFPLHSVAWWMSAWLVLVYALTFVGSIAVLLASPFAGFRMEILGWVLAAGYLSTARYLTIERPGEPFRTQFGLWLLTPAALALNIYLGPVLRCVGLATCLNDNWASRQRVEVGIG